MLISMDVYMMKNFQNRVIYNLYTLFTYIYNLYTLLPPLPITQPFSDIDLELIQSPLNYTGGKFKLLPQILPLFPENIDIFASQEQDEEQKMQTFQEDKDRIKQEIDDIIIEIENIQNSNIVHKKEM